MITRAICVYKFGSIKRIYYDISMKIVKGITYLEPQMDQWTEAIEKSKNTKPNFYKKNKYTIHKFWKNN